MSGNFVVFSRREMGIIAQYSCVDPHAAANLESIHLSSHPCVASLNRIYLPRKSDQIASYRVRSCLSFPFARLSLSRCRTQATSLKTALLTRVRLFLVSVFYNDLRWVYHNQTPSVRWQRSTRAASVAATQPHAGVSCCRRHCRRLPVGECDPHARPFVGGFEGCESASDRSPDSRQDQGVQGVFRAGQEARGPGRGSHCQVEKKTIFDGEVRTARSGCRNCCRRRCRFQFLRHHQEWRSFSNRSTIWCGNESC